MAGANLKTKSDDFYKENIEGKEDYEQFKGKVNEMKNYGRMSKETIIMRLGTSYVNFEMNRRLDNYPQAKEVKDLTVEAVSEMGQSMGSAASSLWGFSKVSKWVTM